MSESTPSGSTHKLTGRFGKLNPFRGKSRREEDDEDFGEDIDDTTVAGGGHSGLDTVHHDLRVSDAVKVFLARQEVVDANDADGLASLLDKPVISPPSHVLDRSHPLPEYFISSSHNTYLKAHQLFGKSDAAAYETILKAGARCVEIDAWDNPDNQEEPKVTHGYTLVSNVPFRAVCEIIRDVVDYEAALPPVQGYGAAPILLSLENHCDPAGQLRLASIMREVFGDRLLSAAVRAKGHEEQSQEDPNTHVRLSDLGNKIAVIVEYHLPGEADSDSSSDSSSSSSSSEDEEERKAHDEYVAKKKAEPPASKVIIPELAELGVYAQSVKPSDNSWYANGGALNNGPHHHLINVSEVGLASHVGSVESVSGSAIAKHNSRHLMRVFPKGTRISSKNLTPVPFWSLGAQILALNWQSFGAPMQLNEALFAGTAGYVLKPTALRPGGDISSAPKPKRRLKLRIGGATDVPLPNGREVSSLKPYVTATLVQGNPSNLSVIKSKKKTGVYKRHGLKAALASLHGSEGLVSPTETDPLWDETLEWEYEDDELVFLRIFIKSDDSFSSNPILAVTAVRVLYVVQGWGFLRLLDLRGHPTGCTLLVHFEVENL